MQSFILEKIEDWYDKLDERQLKCNPEQLFTQGRFVGEMDVLGDLLEAINNADN